MDLEEIFEKSKNFIEKFLKEGKTFYVDEKSIKTIIPDSFHGIRIGYYRSKKGDVFTIILGTTNKSLSLEEIFFDIKEAEKRLLKLIEEKYK